MNKSMDDALDDLKAALLLLKATGEIGFEGLLAAALGEITGIPFRLSASGSQRGIDAGPAYSHDSVCLEGKRYDGQIPRPEVLSKVAELSIRESNQIDLWVLGATSAVGAQLAADVRELGEDKGISILVLDWAGPGIPPLAVALAMSAKSVATFLTAQLAAEQAAKAQVALDAIRQCEAFADHEVRIRTFLSESITGTGIARRDNVKWLTRVFSDRREAKKTLGQPLSPSDASGIKALTRDALMALTSRRMMDEPDGKIIAVLGAEGNGKSWLVAQSWLSLAEKPIMLVFSADDFVGAKAEDAESILIRKLTTQTGQRVSDAVASRWRRKFVRWRRHPVAWARLVVFVDGLNQRPDLDWARLLEGLASELASTGGRLIVTARTVYFRERVQRRLTDPVEEIEVPEWSEAERDAILAQYDISGSNLHAPVALSLTNPRLLGIALELFQGNEIRDLNELSVSRLLFEHIRANERDGPTPLPARDFAKKLQKHAVEILSRHRGGQLDDLKVFEEGLEAVSDGRFFVALADDPTVYALDENGLTLALGLALLDQLRTALRNGRDPAASLDEMIESITALDEAADVVMAAVTVACIDESCPGEVGAAAVCGFAEMQNPNTDTLAPFAGLARMRVEVFMQAAKTLCLSGGRQPNFDWIEEALCTAKRDDAAWQSMARAIEGWLRIYSQSAADPISPHHRPEKIAAEFEQAQEKLESRLKALSLLEKDMLRKLAGHDGGSVGVLSYLAFVLMAGKPIAPFAEALCLWSFGNALNPGRSRDSTTAFVHLVRFNSVDWLKTRNAILQASVSLQEAGVSTTGKWALVTLLQSTGDPDDAKGAEVLVDELTADRPRFEGWRLVERYCANDPCDPNSERPVNVVQTAEKYSALDVSQLRMSRGSTVEDGFFDEGCPGLARFEPNVAITKRKESMADVFEREGPMLSLGISLMAGDSALLTRQQALHLLQLQGESSKTGTQPLPADADSLTVARFGALLAFPHLSAQEQAEALLSLPSEDAILRRLVDVMKPLAETTFETLLEAVCQADDESGQFRLLIFGAYTDTAVSERARRRVAALVRSPAARVRTEALAVIARLGDEDLLKEVVESGWSAAGLSPESRREAWHGSRVITDAAVRGKTPADDAVERVAPAFYGQAAIKLSGRAAQRIAQRVDVSLRTAARLNVDQVVPDIEVPILERSDPGPSLYSVRERQTHSDDPVELFKQMSEGAEGFAERQRRAHEAFDAFRSNLTTSKAEIILDGIGMAEFDAIAAADEALAESWFQLFMKPETNLAAVGSLGHLLARALSTRSAEQAARLFTLLGKQQPLVRMTLGHVGVPLEAATIWSAAAHPELDELRWQRMDKAENDHQIAVEVLAALREDRGDYLQMYVEDRAANGQPAKIARALTVAGFSTQSDFCEHVLSRFANSAGFLGTACKAAIYAYDRNVWAEHWYGRMQRAETPEDFWRYSVLFTKIVDRRVYMWQRDESESGEPFRLFWPSIESGLQNRFEKWRRHREGKLFGGDVPNSKFLV